MAERRGASRRFACRQCFRDGRLREWISRQRNLAQGPLPNAFIGRVYFLNGHSGR